MSEIIDALTAYYAEQSSVTAPVGIRQDLGLAPTILGWTNDVTGLGRQDTFTVQRIKARSLGVESDFEGVAGAYAWRANETIVSLAADVVRFRVLGDLALKAIRTDVAYRDVAREYFSQAKESLNAAIKAIADALKPQTSEPEEIPTSDQFRSVSVGVRRRY